jgi:mono/diheme cytochrome c family protein
MAPISNFERRPCVAGACRRGAAMALAFFGLSLTGAPALAQARGYMLYSQHCIACHTEQVHWRDGRLARDWTSLNLQVRRWQSVASLNWDEEDIQNVTRYLNTRYYDFWPPTELTAVPVTVPRAPRSGSAAAR